MIIAKTISYLSNPEGVKYHGNNEIVPPPSGFENNRVPVCYNNNIPSGLKKTSERR